MDKSIIDAAAKGDKKSFKMIFDHYLPKMRPVALRYARTIFESEDILQDSFLKVYFNLKHYKNKGGFESWIRTIVVNTALNNYKKNRHLYSSQNIESIMDTALEMAEKDISLDEMDASAILEAINELPEGYRMVFNLYVFEGYSHKEIADLLEISEGTSRSQFFKARAMLKKIISQATK